MTITKHGRRFWRVLDDDGSLVAVTAYRKGAKEVVRRLSAARQAPAERETGETTRDREDMTEKKGEQ